MDCTSLSGGPRWEALDLPLNHNIYVHSAAAATAAGTQGEECSAATAQRARGGRGSFRGGLYVIFGRAAMESTGPAAKP